VSRHWFRYAMARPESDLEAQCTFDELAGETARTGGDLREILISIAGLETFRQIAVSSPEATP